MLTNAGKFPLGDVDFNLFVLVCLVSVKSTQTGHFVMVYVDVDFKPSQRLLPML